MHVHHGEKIIFLSAHEKRRLYNDTLMCNMFAKLRGSVAETVERTTSSHTLRLPIVLLRINSADWHGQKTQKHDCYHSYKPKLKLHKSLPYDNFNKDAFGSLMFLLSHCSLPNTDLFSDLQRPSLGEKTIADALRTSYSAKRDYYGIPSAHQQTGRMF